MAKNRKHQSAAIRFGPALKAFLLCLLICGACLGYVWQKSQIYELGQQIRKRELHLKDLRDQNDKLRRQLAYMQSPESLRERVKDLNLGLMPSQPSQVWYLQEPVKSETPTHNRELASRQPASVAMNE
jgi:cell division protein FtsL